MNYQYKEFYNTNQLEITRDGNYKVIITKNQQFFSFMTIYD